MSLINEALKKAQRQRTTAPDGDAASAPGDQPVHKRAAPMRAQTMIVVAAAAIALVVCSVIATVFLLTRKPAEVAKPVAAGPAKLPSVDLNAPSPVIVAPVVPAPIATTSPAAGDPANTPAPAKAVPAAVTPKPSLPAAVAAAPAPSPAAATPAAPVPPAPRAASHLPPDPRILQFVDAIKVTGIRSSGSDSKVLMNDRVFRVNEIVERTLEVKLVKVASDSLTFEDANGVIYTKTF
jgi:hypothetical protein